MQAHCLALHKRRTSKSNLRNPFSLLFDLMAEDRPLIDASSSVNEYVVDRPKTPIEKVHSRFFLVDFSFPFRLFLRFLRMVTVEPRPELWERLPPFASSSWAREVLFFQVCARKSGMEVLLWRFRSWLCWPFTAPIWWWDSSRNMLLARICRCQSLPRERSDEWWEACARPAFLEPQSEAVLFT